MITQEWIDLSDRYIMSTYKRHPLVLTRGLGVHVWDCEGRCYLDLVGGIAVCALGHAHPKVVTASSWALVSMPSATIRILRLVPRVVMLRNKAAALPAGWSSVSPETKDWSIFSSVTGRRCR